MNKYNGLINPNTVLQKKGDKLSESELSKRGFELINMIKSMYILIQLILFICQNPRSDKKAAIVHDCGFIS
jgi:hypothetical protein